MWRLFGIASVLVVVVSLAATVPSGDRTEIVLSLWGVLMVVGLGAALTWAIITPPPDNLGSATGPRGGFIDVGGWGGDGGGFGDGGGCGGGDGC